MELVVMKNNSRNANTLTSIDSSQNMYHIKYDQLQTQRLCRRQNIEVAVENMIGGMLKKEYTLN